jgi:hypothetical protein
MKNATSNSANSAKQPTLPGVRDWTQPITARGSELAAVIAEAQAAGFHAHRMKVSSQALYELKFFRLAVTAEAGNLPKKSKDSFLREVSARNSCIRAVSRETKIK